jgi:PST family polysaccharide transporter
MTRRGGPTSLGASVRSGTLWTTLNVFVSRLLQFVSTLIVARLVAPEHFGALAVGIAVQMILLNANELGATASLARGHRDPDEIAPTIYTIALITSTALTAAMIGFAAPLARLMRDPEATPVIQVLALTVLLGGISSVPAALLWRDFKQKQRLLADLANAVVSTLLVIPMALAGWEAMALACSRVGGQLAAVVVFLAVCGKRYLPGYDPAVLREVLRVGLPLALANVVVFLTLNADYAVVGRLLGPEQLGLYLIAFNVANLPGGVFTQVVRSVAVPAFGRLHAEGRLTGAVTQSVVLVAYLTLPVGALLAATATPAIAGLYGARWSAAAPALVWLSLFALGRAFSDLLSDLCLAVGRTGKLFLVQVVWLVALVPALWLCVNRWGIAGAGIAHLIVIWVVVLPAYFRAIRVETRVSLADCVWGAVVPLVASVVGAGVALMISRPIGPPLVALVVGGLAGLATYVALVARSALPLLRGFGVLGRRPAAEEGTASTSGHVGMT